MVAEEGGRVFETEKTVGTDLEGVGVVPRSDQLVFLHRKAGELSVPEQKTQGCQQKHLAPS